MLTSVSEEIMSLQVNKEKIKAALNNIKAGSSTKIGTWLQKLTSRLYIELEIEYTCSE